ncbi:MAG: hypothetical protein J2P25_23925 [Nocardiopsaceae bacterium]|nr:hypothetical protein [Nocardiopsaceae bacterium]
MNSAGSRVLSWLADNADAAIGLTIAVVASILGILSLVPTYVVTNVTVLTLATMTFVLLRDRHRAETSARQIEKSLGDTRGEAREFFDRSVPALEKLPDSGQVAEWQDTVARLRDVLEHASMVQVVPGEEVGRAHTRARLETDRWVFKGGTGTYLRAVTLPECVKAAREGHRTLKVQFEIVDPANRELCERYAAFRASLADPDAAGEMWTLDRVRKEALATVLAACWHRQRYFLLDVAGALSGGMTTMRMDMSSSYLIITQESTTSPALVVEAGKPHFTAYAKELQSSFEQARLVDFSRSREVPLGDEPTVDEARRLLAALGLPPPSTFTDRDVSDIIGKAVRPLNPYQ